MKTRLDVIEARLEDAGEATYERIQTTGVQGYVVKTRKSQWAIDQALLLAVAKAAVEYVAAERAWNEADMLVGNSQEDWENVHAAYDMAVERSKAAMKALDAAVASLLMQEVTE